MVEKTQRGLRKRICLLGPVNAGKSSLMNALIGENVSIVSENPGTTTDSQTRAFEILGLGPVVFCDTAGFGDQTLLGKEREEAALKTLRESDLVLLIRTSSELSGSDKYLYDLVCSLNLPYLVVYNKKDCYTPPLGSISTNALTGEGVCLVLQEIKKALSQSGNEPVLNGLVSEGDHVLLVTPIDSSAPAGRIILPQVQVLRELLDKRAIATVIQTEELELALKRNEYDLVITDSKVIKEVLSIVSPHQKVLTFSVLFARTKGNFDTFLKGCTMIDSLKDGDRILIAEACVHTTHEDDIAKTVIPKLLEKRTGKRLSFSFTSGGKFPEDLSPYALIVHCGSCMLTRRQLLNRIERAESQQVPITNYGLCITKCQMGNIQRLISSLS